MGIIAMIIQAMTLLPTMVKTVKELFDLFERPGHGEEKREGLLNTVSATLPPDLDPRVRERLMAAAEQTIECEVALRNADKGNFARMAAAAATYSTQVPIPGASRLGLPDGYEWDEPLPPRDIIEPGRAYRIRKIKADDEEKADVWRARA